MAEPLLAWFAARSLEKGCAVLIDREFSQDKTTACVLAARYCDLALLNHLISEIGVNPSANSGYPLCLLCEPPHAGSVSSPCSARAVACGEFPTPLHAAVGTRNVDVVTYLLQAGADTECDDEVLPASCYRPGKCTPLSFAAALGDLECVQALLRGVAGGPGADVNAARYDNVTPFMRACTSGSLPTAKLLVAHGAELENMDWGGQSALHRACMVGDFAIAQWLVEELGFPPDFHNEEIGVTPLLCACQHGRLEIVKWLLETYSVDPHLPIPALMYTQGLSFGVLEAACVGGSLDTVKYLIDSCGFDVGRLRETLKFKTGRTVFAEAVSEPKGKALAVAAWLLSMYPEMLEQEDEDGESPLQLLCSTSPLCLESLHWLLSVGADVHRRTQYGETLLATLAHHTVMGSDVASSGDSDTGTLFDGMRALISAGACTQSVVIDLDTNELTSLSTYVTEVLIEDESILPQDLMDPRCLRWYRRVSWLHGIQKYHSTTSSESRARASGTALPLIDGVDPGVVSLLLDRRLLVCRGPLVASAQVGFAISFMHECCEDPECPTNGGGSGNIPYRDRMRVVRRTAADGQSDASPSSSAGASVDSPEGDVSGDDTPGSGGGSAGSDSGSNSGPYGMRRRVPPDDYDVEPARVEARASEDSSRSDDDAAELAGRRGANTDSASPGSERSDEA